MKVIGWIDYAEIEDDFIESFGGMGGWFDNGMRWKDYINTVKPEYKKYPEAIRLAVIHSNIRITGEQHQYGHDGVPVFSDGTYASFSYRAWGDIMGAIWSDVDDKDYNYMSFYM